MLCGIRQIHQYQAAGLEYPLNNLGLKARNQVFQKNRFFPRTIEMIRFGHRMRALHPVAMWVDFP